MKIFRWLGAGLVWIVAGLVGLVGGLLCVTILLLPLGIPLIMLSRRLFSLAGRMMLPAAVRHPVKELDKKGSGVAKRTRQEGKKRGSALRKTAEKKVGRRNRLGLKWP
ncbi:hypothetical protein [Nocardioides sp.]|uniref:hypothetical protein n=1 Tax=Nocardioides sp. TaxID=35761 RepID=UPI002ED0B28C